MPKKISGLLLALIVCFGALSGCEGSPKGKAEYEFYTVKELYDSGEISRQDLLTIAYYVNHGSIEQNAEKYPEDFVPTPKTPAELDESKPKNVAKAFKDYIDKKPDYKIGDYLGCYGNGYSVVYMLSSGGAPDVLVDYFVDDILMFIPDPGHELIAYKAIEADPAAAE